VLTALQITVGTLTEEATMRIIMTGGIGLIGTALIDTLHDHEIIVLSRDPSRAALQFKDKSVQIAG
jgi:NAD dependent epimerase/dehydratase family enzyme